MDVSLANLYADDSPVECNVEWWGGEALLGLLALALLAQSFIFFLSGPQSAEGNIRITRTGQPPPSSLLALQNTYRLFPFGFANAVIIGKDTFTF